MAPHMGPKRISRRMRLSISRTPGPFADESLLAVCDMNLVDVPHQRVHIAQIVRIAPRPPTHGDLVATVATVLVVLRAAQQRLDAGRVGDVAAGVGGDGG